MSRPLLRGHYGLTERALKQGYYQQVFARGANLDLLIQLHAVIGGYETYVWSNTPQLPGHRFRTTTDNLSEARSQWREQVSKHCASAIAEMKADTRYSVTREYHGERDPSWVARWLGAEVIYAAHGGTGTFGCTTSEEAWMRCYAHRWNRDSARS